MKTAAAGVREGSDAVLDAADNLFYARGFSAASVDEIRDAAGVSLKALYAAYPSKSAIVAAYLRRRDDRWRDAISSYVTSRSSDPREQLLLVFDALTEFLARPGPVRGCAFQKAFAQSVGTDEAAANIVRAHKDHARKVLVDLARAAGVRSPDDLGGQLMLLLEGALITAAISGDRGVAATARGAAEVLIEAHAAAASGVQSPRRRKA